MGTKTAIVTGASRGIGLATARALAAHGFQVVGAARTVTDELDDVCASTLAVDLATPRGASDLVDHALERHGGIDVLVNNVGLFTARTDGFAAVSDADWQETFEVNFFSAVRVIRAALPSLLEHRGTIIDIGSLNARLPQPPVVDYAASKAALKSLGASLAEELGPQGVQVTTVSPGVTRSSAWTSPVGFGADLARASGVSLDEFLQGFADQAGIATGAMTEPEEVAAVVALIASGQVPNAHGADWLLDGGQDKAA